MKSFLVVTVIVLLGATALWSESRDYQDPDAPWESQDIPQDRTHWLPSKAPREGDIYTDVIDSLISDYEIYLSNKTVHRSAFVTSTSVFTVFSLERKGDFLGTLAFIDRYFYRDNFASFDYYGLRLNQDGIYKIDDDYFWRN